MAAKLEQFATLEPFNEFILKELYACQERLHGFVDRGQEGVKSVTARNKAKGGFLACLVYLCPDYDVDKLWSIAEELIQG